MSHAGKWRWKISSRLEAESANRGKLLAGAIQLITRIYEENPYVNAIILTQPQNIMAFGASNARLDVRIIPESWFFLRDVPRMEFGNQYYQIETIAKMFTPETPAILVENDSIIVTGNKLLQTFDRLEIAEFTARSIIMGHPLGELLTMSQDQIDEMTRIFG